MIDQSHKALLKHVLQNKFQEVTQPTLTSSHIISMSNFYRWSLVPGLAVVGLATWAVVANHTQPQLSFLDHVQVALAAEVTQASDTIHHQTITIIDTTQPNKVITQDQWDSPTSSVTKFLDANGVVTDELATISDKKYELHPVAIPLSEDTESQVTCVLNLADAKLPVSGSMTAKQQADAIANAVTAADRQAQIQELLTNSAVQDLGEHDGLHTFSITQADHGDATIYEYSFDPTSFVLRQYRVRYRYLINTSDAFDEYSNTYSYLVNEYVAPETVSAEVWDTSALTEVTTPFRNQATGCYDNTGKKVSDITYVSQVVDNGDTNIVLDQSLPENKYLTNLVVNNKNNQVDGLGIVFTNSDKSDQGQPSSVTIQKPPLI